METVNEYVDGAIVWVKLGGLWWPGEVYDVTRLPEGLLASMRKEPIAFVKFFQENTFQYVHHLSDIYMYHCPRKSEFIKKGLRLFRKVGRINDIDKFPDDVATAERRTNGDPNIILTDEFQPETKTNYSGIFGGTPTPGQIVSTPRTVRPGRSAEIQRPTGSSSQSRLASTSSVFDTPVLQDTSSAQKMQSSSSESKFNCNSCTFSTNRLDVIVMHYKIHSKSNQSPNVKRLPSSSMVRPNAASSSVSSVKSIVNISSTFPKFSEPVCSTDKHTKTPVRHTDTPVKHLARQEIKKTLLADWSGDEDDEVEGEIDGKPIIHFENPTQANATLGVNTAIVETIKTTTDIVVEDVAPKSPPIRYRNIPKKDRREIIIDKFVPIVPVEQSVTIIPSSLESSDNCASIATATKDPLKAHDATCDTSKPYKKRNIQRSSPDVIAVDSAMSISVTVDAVSVADNDQLAQKVQEFLATEKESTDATGEIIEKIGNAELNESPPVLNLESNEDTINAIEAINCESKLKITVEKKTRSRRPGRSTHKEASDHPEVEKILDQQKPRRERPIKQNETKIFRRSCRNRTAEPDYAEESSLESSNNLVALERPNSNETDSFNDIIPEVEHSVKESCVVSLSDLTLPSETSVMVATENIPSTSSEIKKTIPNVINITAEVARNIEDLSDNANGSINTTHCRRSCRNVPRIKSPVLIQKAEIIESNMIEVPVKLNMTESTSMNENMTSLEICNRSSPYMNIMNYSNERKPVVFVKCTKPQVNEEICDNQSTPMVPLVEPSRRGRSSCQLLKTSDKKVVGESSIIIDTKTKTDEKIVDVFNSVKKSINGDEDGKFVEQKSVNATNCDPDNSVSLLSIEPQDNIFKDMLNTTTNISRDQKNQLNAMCEVIVHRISTNELCSWTQTTSLKNYNVKNETKNNEVDNNISITTIQNEPNHELDMYSSMDTNISSEIVQSNMIHSENTEQTAYVEHLTLNTEPKMPIATNSKESSEIIENTEIQEPDMHSNIDTPIVSEEAQSSKNLAKTNEKTECVETAALNIKPLMEIATISTESSEQITNQEVHEVDTHSDMETNGSSEIVQSNTILAENTEQTGCVEQAQVISEPIIAIPTISSESSEIIGNSDIHEQEMHSNMNPNIASENDQSNTILAEKPTECEQATVNTEPITTIETISTESSELNKYSENVDNAAFNTDHFTEQSKCVENATVNDEPLITKATISTESLETINHAKIVANTALHTADIKDLHCFDFTDEDDDQPQTIICNKTPTIENTIKSTVPEPDNNSSTSNNPEKNERAPIPLTGNSVTEPDARNRQEHKKRIFKSRNRKKTVLAIVGEARKNEHIQPQPIPDINQISGPDSQDELSPVNERRSLQVVLAKARQKVEKRLHKTKSTDVNTSTRDIKTPPKTSMCLTERDKTREPIAADQFHHNIKVKPTSGNCSSSSNSRPSSSTSSVSGRSKLTKHASLKCNKNSLKHSVARDSPPIQTSPAKIPSSSKIIEKPSKITSPILSSTCTQPSPTGTSGSATTSYVANVARKRTFEEQLLSANIPFERPVKHIKYQKNSKVARTAQSGERKDITIPTIAASTNVLDQTSTPMVPDSFVTMGGALAKRISPKTCADKSSTIVVGDGRATDISSNRNTTSITLVSPDDKRQKNTYVLPVNTSIQVRTALGATVENQSCSKIQSVPADAIEQSRSSDCDLQNTETFRNTSQAVPNTIIDTQSNKIVKNSIKIKNKRYAPSQPNLTAPVNRKRKQPSRIQSPNAPGPAIKPTTAKILQNIDNALRSLVDINHSQMLVASSTHQITSSEILPSRTQSPENVIDTENSQQQPTIAHDDSTNTPFPSSKTPKQPTVMSVDSAVDTKTSSSTLETDNLLALPADDLGGPPGSYYLCKMLPSGEYVKASDQVFYLDNEQRLQPLDDGEMPVFAVNAVQTLHDMESSQIVLQENHNATGPAIGDTHESMSDAPTTFLLNTADGQQIYLDQQGILELAASGQTPGFITPDGRQIVLQNTPQEILSAIGLNDDIVNSLMASGQQQHVIDVNNPHHLYHQQQQEHSALIGELDMIFPAPTSSVGAVVTAFTSETNATQTPILSTLEQPTKAEHSHLHTSVSPIDILVGQSSNLDQSLAVIGVTQASVPTSLELPITVTNPAIASRCIANPLSLTFTNSLHSIVGLTASNSIITSIPLAPSETTAADGEAYDSNSIVMEEDNDVSGEQQNRADPDVDNILIDDSDDVVPVTPDSVTNKASIGSQLNVNEYSSTSSDSSGEIPMQPSIVADHLQQQNQQSRNHGSADSTEGCVFDAHQQNQHPPESIKNGDEEPERQQMIVEQPEESYYLADGEQPNEVVVIDENHASAFGVDEVLQDAIFGIVHS